MLPGQCAMLPQSMGRGALPRRGPARGDGADGDEKTAVKAVFCNQAEPICLDGLLFTAQGGKQGRDELGELGGDQGEVGV